MPITHRVGNLFDSKDVQAIAHGVNCVGVMGAGIAVEFKRRYPDMFKRYRQTCIVHDSDRLVGNYMIWMDEEANIFIYNLFTQPKTKGMIGLATLDNIYNCLFNMLEDAGEKGITDIGIPRIGAGLGGLEWDEVEEVINEVLTDTGSVINIIVHSLA